MFKISTKGRQKPAFRSTDKVNAPAPQAFLMKSEASRLELV